MITLSEETWQAYRQRDLDRAQAILQPHLQRRSRGICHPVYDFLFEYYTFRPAHLTRWTPGIDAHLQGATPAELSLPQVEFDSSGGYLHRRHLPSHRLASWQWILTLLQITQHRPPHFQCYGLHEWAMVYRGEKRHATVPLRVSSSELESFLEAQAVSCTHFDAFRFFTPSARPLNMHSLNRENRHTYEQRGCIHVTMDLYKWSYKLWPWIPTDLILDALQLAIEAREIDMRASPYDLRGWNFDPIKIETSEGRTEYQRHQAQLAQKAVPIRQRLIYIYQQILT
jgi:hypothetical protein